MPFWENEYCNNKTFVFGKPSKEVVDSVPYLKKGARILDVGCGDGRHAIYLAKLGFKVDAFDLSQNAINKLNGLKGELPISTMVCDIEDFPFKTSYDCIIIHGVLQFVSKQRQKRIIELLKKWTNSNGFHLIAVFTNEVPIPDDLKSIMIGVFSKQEIKEYYQDWTIVDFKEVIFQDEHENGLKHTHAMNKMIARKG